MNNFGFIIARHVNSQLTNKYWNNCVRCIRFFYPLKKIIIIDDNSNYDYVNDLYKLDNIEVIQSEFHGRGELLPYYYFLKYKFFDNAIIMHDSVFFHARINFEKLIGMPVLPLWHFESDKENSFNLLRVSDVLINNSNIKNSVNSNNYILPIKQMKWYGCFGVQSFINHNFLKFIENKYKISNLIQTIKCRKDRCCLERIMGIIFCNEYDKLLNIKSLFGDIFEKQTWGYNFEQYMDDFEHKKISKPIIKVWTGR
jgi:hypothetical protein